MNIEDNSNETCGSPKQGDTSSVALAGDQAFVNFEMFLTGLSTQEKETKLDQQFLQSNFRLKEVHSTLELNVVKTIYHIILQKSKQMTEKKMKKNWTDDETSLLLWIVRVISLRHNQEAIEFSEDQWKDIAKMIPYKAYENCKLRWLYLKKNSVQCTPWTEEEDQNLSVIIQKKGANSNKWNEIAKALYSMSTSKTFRKGKQCRERWNNHLDPEMKRGQWTDAEDLQLLQLSYDNGNKWSYIAKELKERTENAVKNRYKSLIRKEEKENKSQSQTLIQFSSSSLQDIQGSNSQMTPEQQKISSIILKLQNKINSENSGCLREQNQSISERIEEEDVEEDFDDNDEEQEGENYQIEQNGNAKNKQKYADANQKQNKCNKIQSQNMQVNRKRKSSNNNEKSIDNNDMQIEKNNIGCDDNEMRNDANDMQIEGKIENSSTSAQTDCHTIDLHMSENKMATLSTIFTPSCSPNREINIQNTHNDRNEDDKSIGTSKILSCQKNNRKQDEITNDSNYQNCKQSKQLSGIKKKQCKTNINQDNKQKNKQGGVSTFTDALLLQPTSSSRSSSPSLLSGEQNCKNPKKIKKIEKNDSSSQTTQSTAAEKESSQLNPQKIKQGFVHRSSIRSCTTPLGQNSIFNPFYSNNAAPSPNTQLVNQFNNLYLQSKESTPSSIKRRNTLSGPENQNQVFEAFYKKRAYTLSQNEDNNENSNEEEGQGCQRTKKIIVLKGNQNNVNVVSDSVIQDTQQGSSNKINIEQESNKQLIFNNFQQLNNMQFKQQQSDDISNNENYNESNIIKKMNSQPSCLKFSSNNSAFKQFCSSPISGPLIRPKQSSFQMYSLNSGSSTNPPLSSLSQTSDSIITSPLNSPQLLSQLSQCVVFKQTQQNISLQNKN